MQSRNGGPPLPDRRRPVVRTRTALLALLAFVPLGACATKRDVRDLRGEIVELRRQQDSLLSVVQRQNRALADTAAVTLDAISRLRGDLGNQLSQMEQEHLQIQELTGQSQRRVQELREQIAERNVRMAAPGGVDTTAGAPAPAGAATDSSGVEQLYAAAQANLERGATGTARAAFQQIVQDHPDSPRAPDAQFGIAETYYRDGDFENALHALEQVVEMFPGSARAPGALYRAGVIAQERGNNQRARDYFRRVVAGWPKSDEARMATEALSHLPR